MPSKPYKKKVRKAEAIAIGRARTFDGREVIGYDNGTFTWTGGHPIRTVHSFVSEDQRSHYLRAVTLVLNELAQYDATEVSTLVWMARKATRMFEDDERARQEMKIFANRAIQTKGFSSEALKKRLAK